MASTQSHLTKERLFVDANGRPKPGLVVVPPGLIRNWPRELVRWANDLAGHVYYGQQRQLPRGASEVDIVLTWRAHGN